MKKAIIITAHGAENFTDFIRISPEDYIIAADGGYDAVRKLGIVPNVLAGDMDSISSVPKNTEVIILPAEKDDTDTHFCAKLALKRGFDNVTIIGGMTGRLDHTLANLHTLAFLVNNGARARMLGHGTKVYMISDELELEFDIRHTVSLFAYGGTARGVCISGVKYPLNNATLTLDFPIGVSNVAVEPVVKVSVENGLVFVVA